MDNASGLKQPTEAYNAIWKEVSYSNQRRVRIPLLSSTRTGSHEGHAQLAMDALVASLAKGDARLTKCFEEAEVVELCVPSTREHVKVAKIQEKIEANTMAPDTRSAGRREGTEPTPRQDTDNTTEADVLAECWILDTNELEKLASKDHVPSVWQQYSGRPAKAPTRKPSPDSENLSGERQSISWEIP